VRKSQNGVHRKVAASQLLSLWGFPLSGSMLCNKSVQAFQFSFKEPFRRHHSSSTKTWSLHLAMILRIDCQPAAHTQLWGLVSSCLLKGNCPNGSLLDGPLETVSQSRLIDCFHLVLKAMHHFKREKVYNKVRHDGRLKKIQEV
jgi:hypothetical protein